MKYIDHVNESICDFDKLFRKMMFFLVYSDTILVRVELVRRNYKLDILINDPSWIVRREIVRHNYKLDILVNDSDWRVRDEVAENYYGLDILINDPNKIVKETAKRKQDEIHK